MMTTEELLKLAEENPEEFRRVRLQILKEARERNRIEIDEEEG